MASLMVLEADANYLIQFNEAETVYAVGVDTVYRYFLNLTTQVIYPDCLWEPKAELRYS